MLNVPKGPPLIYTEKYDRILQKHSVCYFYIMFIESDADDYKLSWTAFNDSVQFFTKSSRPLPLAVFEVQVSSERAKLQLKIGMFRSKQYRHRIIGPRKRFSYFLGGREDLKTNFYAFLSLKC